MKTKDSKAMLEVWEMKEHAYNMLKHLSPDEQMKKVAEISAKIINQNNWQHKIFFAKNNNAKAD
jgi:hypothetical protein